MTSVRVMAVKLFEALAASILNVHVISVSGFVVSKCSICTSVSIPEM